MPSLAAGIRRRGEIKLNTGGMVYALRHLKSNNISLIRHVDSWEIMREICVVALGRGERRYQLSSSHVVYLPYNLISS